MKKSWCNKTSFSSIIESSEMSQMKARYDIYPTSFVWNFQKSHNFNDIVLFYITSLQISIKRFHEKAILKPLKIWIWISTISQKTVKSSNFSKIALHFYQFISFYHFKRIFWSRILAIGYWLLYPQRILNLQNLKV